MQYSPSPSLSPPQQPSMQPSTPHPFYPSLPQRAPQHSHKRSLDSIDETEGLGLSIPLPISPPQSIKRKKLNLEPAFERLSFRDDGPELIPLDEVEQQQSLIVPPEVKIITPTPVLGSGEQEDEGGSMEGLEKEKNTSHTVWVDSLDSDSETSGSPPSSPKSSILPQFLLKDQDLLPEALINRKAKEGALVLYRPPPFYLVGKGEEGEKEEGVRETDAMGDVERQDEQDDEDYSMDLDEDG